MEADKGGGRRDYIKCLRNLDTGELALGEREEKIVHYDKKTV